MSIPPTGRREASDVDLIESRRTVRASDGITLAYWIRRGAAGARTPVLFIHGAASNHTRWSELVERTTLGATWDLVRPDMRGNGQSMHRGRLDLRIWSRDLAEILDAEGFREALLVGHSLGAQIAMRFAADHVARVTGLVLIDPVFPRALRGRRRALSRLAPLFRLAIAALRLLNAVGFRRRRFPDRDLRQLDETTRQAMRAKGDSSELARRYSSLRPILRYMPIANYLQQLLATVAPPPPGPIAAPTLVLLSSGITFADAAVNREELGRFAHAKIVPIDADHWPLTEKPGAVRRAIESWLGATFADRHSPGG